MLLPACQWILLIAAILLLGDGLWLAWKEASPMKWVTSAVTLSFYAALITLWIKKKISLSASLWSSLCCLLLLFFISVRFYDTETLSGYRLWLLPAQKIVMILYILFVAATLLAALSAPLHRVIKTGAALMGCYALFGLMQALIGNFSIERAFAGAPPFSSAPLYVRPFFFALALYLPASLAVTAFYIIRTLIRRERPSSLMTGMALALLFLLALGLSPLMPRRWDIAVSDKAFTGLRGRANLLSQCKGGELVSFSSQQDNRFNAAFNLNEKKNGLCEDGKKWSSLPGAAFPHELIYTVAGEEGAVIDSIMLCNSIPETNQGVKDFEVWGAPSPGGPFAPIGRFRAANSPFPQTFTFRPSAVRSLKFLITSNWKGQQDSFTSLHKLEACGKIPLLPMKASRNLLAAEDGAWCMAGKGKGVSGMENLLRRQQGGSCQCNTLPCEIIVSLSGEQCRLINTMLFTFPKSGQGIKSMEISLSDRSPSSGFRKAGRLTRHPGEEEIQMTFRPRVARYIKIRVISSYGGPAEIWRIMAFQPPLHASEAPLPRHQPGLAVSRHEGLNYGSPVTESVESRPERGADTPGNSASEWKGFLQVPAHGLYQMAVRADNGIMIKIDGEKVMEDWKEKNPLFWNTMDLTLSKGLHRIEILSMHRTGSPCFSLAWRRAGSGPLAVIADSCFSHDPQRQKKERTPRHAAQEGLDWLEPEAMKWQDQNNCFGCHVQTHALMGHSIARRNNYSVNIEARARMESYLSSGINKGGYEMDRFMGFTTSLAYMGLWIAYIDSYVGFPGKDSLVGIAHRLVEHQSPDGFIECDHREPPVDQSRAMTTVSGLFCIDRAARYSQDSQFRNSLQKGISWLRGASLETTQDRVFQIIGLAMLDREASKELVKMRSRELLALQRPDGGWSEIPSLESNAYATGEALYALKTAGISIADEQFMKGVAYLMDRQYLSGNWPCEHSQSGRPSDFAPTMWAVIGLAGSFESFAVSLASPRDNARISLAGEEAQQIEARVFNSTDSPVRELQFMIDGSPVGKTAAEPYRVTWKPRDYRTGPHTIKVTALTESGLTSEDEKEIYLAGKLSLDLTAPKEKEVCTGKTVIIPLIANETGYAVRRVSYSLDGASIGTSTAPPFTLEWNSADAEPREHILHAEAENEKGEKALCDRLVTTAKALRILITRPREGMQIDREADLEAEVYNLTGSPVAEVKYLRPDGTVLGSSAQPPFSVKGDFSSLKEGMCTVKARVTTEKGESAEGTVNATISRPFYVTLYTTVTDGAGHHVTTLARPDFAVAENGRAQKIESVTKTTKDTPLSAVILIDASGSMKGSTPQVIEAAQQFVACLSARDRAALVTFSDRVSETAPFTGDREKLRLAVSRLEAHGGTALYDGIYRASEMLAGEKGKKAIIVLTDGVDENDPGTAPGSLHSFKECLERAREKDCIIYSIGIGNGVDQKIITGLADGTGGRAYLRPGAQDLKRTYGQIAEELRCQYIIRYLSSDPGKDGSWRTITATTPGKSLTVHTKPGFYAPTY